MPKHIPLYKKILNENPQERQRVERRIPLWKSILGNFKSSFVKPTTQVVKTLRAKTGGNKLRSLMQRQGLNEQQIERASGLTEGIIGATAPIKAVKGAFNLVRKRNSLEEIKKRNSLVGVSIGKKKFKQIDNLTKRELEKAIDYIRLKGKRDFDQVKEDNIGRLAEKFNITDKILGNVANKFERLIRDTKTKRIR